MINNLKGKLHKFGRLQSHLSINLYIFFTMRPETTCIPRVGISEESCYELVLFVVIIVN